MSKSRDLSSYGTAALADTGSGANNVITADASGNVGIGTTIINSSLSIGATDGAAVITSGGTNTHLSIKAMGSSGSLIFGAGGVSNGAPGVERMRIDSAGVVTTPNQPAWNVALTYPQTMYGGGTLLWNKSSGGSNFLSGGVTLDGSSGRLTFPVAGKYLLVAAMRTEQAGAVTGTNINLCLNGVTLNRFYAGDSLNSGGSYMNVEPRPFIVNAQANDYITHVFSNVPNTFILSAYTNTVVNFSGYLIG
jgi:hypothetical protein